MGCYRGGMAVLITATALTGTAHPRWHKFARCSAPGVDPDIFFRKGAAARAEAKELCSSCPVRAECLLASEGCEGIWAGLETRERTNLAEWGQ